MRAASLRLAPVRTGMPGIRWLRWTRREAGERNRIEIDDGTLRVAGLQPIPLRRIVAVAHYTTGIGSGLEICLDADRDAEVSRLHIPARAFENFEDAKDISARIEQALLDRSDAAAEEIAEIRRLCRERAARIPWLSFWFASATLALAAAGSFTTGGDAVLAAIAHGAAVPDLIRAGETHRLLSAGLVHSSWLHALPMFVGWLLMIALEKRAGTALIAAGFAGGTAVGYASVAATGGSSWQALGAAPAFVGLIGAIGTTMTIDPERLDALAVRAEAARPIRATGILMTVFALIATSIEARLFGPLNSFALLGGIMGGLFLCAASRTGGLVDKISRNALIALCMGAVGWACFSAVRGPEAELGRYLDVAANSDPVDAGSLSEAIERIAHWNGTTDSLRNHAAESGATALSRTEGDRARERLRAALTAVDPGR